MPAHMSQSIGPLASEPLDALQRLKQRAACNRHRNVGSRFKAFFSNATAAKNQYRHRPCREPFAHRETTIKIPMRRKGRWRSGNLNRTKNLSQRQGRERHLNTIETPPRRNRTSHPGNHGMPASQGELVRAMMDWFAGRENFPPPDERTVRRKVSAIWKELRSE